MSRRDSRTDAAASYNRIYKTDRWQRLRASVLAEQPLCVMCLVVEDVTEANTVDHIKPHRGDEVLMWDRDNLQSLCASCHSSRKQREDRGEKIVAFGADGWPIE